MLLGFTVYDRADRGNRLTPYVVMVTIRDHVDHIRVPLYSCFAAIKGGVPPEQSPELSHFWIYSNWVLVKDENQTQS